MNTYFVKNDQGYIHPTIQPNWDYEAKRKDPADDLVRYCEATPEDLAKYESLLPCAYDKCDIKKINGEYKLIWSE